MTRDAGGEGVRSNRAEVRNPVLATEAGRRLADLGPLARAELRAVLLDIRTDAQARADECWRRHKAPMAAYWKAVAVYTGHITRALNRPTLHRESSHSRNLPPVDRAGAVSAGGDFRGEG